MTVIKHIPSIDIDSSDADAAAYIQLKDKIQQWSTEAGFQQMRITDVNLEDYQGYYQQWLDNNYHGQMSYMQRNVDKRLQPALLHEGTLRCISFRMDYLPSSQNRKLMEQLLQQSQKAYISRYALGRDYHKLIRKRLAALADKIQLHSEEQLNQRAFVDSAPVLERALAEKAGMGWIGKNTMLINKTAGSYFFLAEILTDLPLPLDEVAEQNSNHCGSCTQCLDICPTQAFSGPNQLDARRCISYLTIELHDAIPLELRPMIGNRIYGCDDCLAVCPWNKFASRAAEVKYHGRDALMGPKLAELAVLDDAGFRSLFSGSPVKRIGRARFVRNVCYAIGNSADLALVDVVRGLCGDEDASVADAARWAVGRLVDDG